MIITFLYSLAGGTLAVLAAARIPDIAWKYLRLIGIIVFALMTAVLAWLLAWGEFANSEVGTVPAWEGVVTTIAAALIMIIAPIAQRSVIAFRMIAGIGGLSGLAAAVMATVESHDFEPAAHLAQTLVPIGQVIGALMLGAITAAWILGHAYLTATKMTIKPLLHLSQLLLGFVSLRVIFMLVSLASAYMLDGSSDPTVWSILRGSWLIIVLRIGTGIVGVGLISVMVLKCVRIRSTQSATGLLYFGSILAYIGELASQQLIRECGWPV